MALPTKKLFEVRVELTAFVVAEDETEAMEIGERALVEEAEHAIIDLAIDVQEVTHSDWHLEGGWDARSLVYGAERDTALGTKLQALPKRDHVVASK